MTFQPPAYRPASSERPRISERPSAFPGRPQHTSGSAFSQRKRVRTVQPQGTTEPTPAINITPMIDVVLVLLLVFMAVTPTPASELEVQLVASGAATDPVEVTPEQLVVAIGDSGAIRVGEHAVAARELEPLLRDELARRAPADRVLFVTASDKAGYAALVETIGAAKRAGFTAIGFATDAKR